MEKIYVENNQKKKNGLKKILSSSFSVKCSFMLAIVTMFSVVYSSFNVGNSYALPNSNNDLGDSFETMAEDENLVTIISNNGTTEASYIVSQFFTADKIPVFCLERDKNFAFQSTYTKGEAINDYGLLYLMGNLYPNVQIKDSLGDVLPVEVQTWIAQSAIWDYLYETKSEGNSNQYVPDNGKQALDINIMKATTSIYWGDSPDDTNKTYTLTDGLYNTYVKALVNNAIAHREKPVFSIEGIINSTDITLDSTEKYYKSDLISINAIPIDNFKLFNVYMANYPEGIKFEDESGNEIELVTSAGDNDIILKSFTFEPGSKFRICVPVEKLTEENKKIEISIDGTYNSYAGFYYRSGNLQTISSVKPITSTVNKGFSITFNYTVDTPPTSMNIPKYIFFTGLLILLVGIGIIYANVKTKKEQ